MLYKEESVSFHVPENRKLSKKDVVFYNPDMKLNRDITIWVIKKTKPKSYCDVMSASGVRCLRVSFETETKKIVANDKNPDAYNLIKKNRDLNKLNFVVKNLDANKLLNLEKFDFIDIDPFGSPLPFVDSALKSLNNNGILALTATDIGVLEGVYPKKCEKVYGAKPLKIFFRDEISARILIHKVQTMGFVHDKVLVPIFVHKKNHYLRVYFKCYNKKKCKELVDNKGYIFFCDKCYNYDSSKILNEKICCKKIMKHAGPLWLGQLWDQDLVKDFNLIKHVCEENNNILGYYDLHKIAKKYKIKKLKKIKDVIVELEKKGFIVSRTHFKPEGIRTNAKIKDIILSFS